MKRHCLAAFTPPGANPPYFNATAFQGTVTVTVRSPNGEHAAMDMSLHDWYMMIEQSRSHVLMQGDPETRVNEQLRDFSPDAKLQVAKPSVHSSTPVPNHGAGIDGLI